MTSNPNHFDEARRIRLHGQQVRRRLEGRVNAEFSVGHAKQSMTDGYSKLADDVAFRKEVAEKVGTGFDVPAYETKPMRPMRPKKAVKNRTEVAAYLLIIVR